MDDLEAFIPEVLECAKDVLEKTPDMLPVLKEAGVVDSGGQGLLEVIRGAYDAFLGKEIDYSAIAPGAGAKVTKVTAQDTADDANGEDDAALESDDIITADTATLEEDVHTVTPPEDVDYDSLAIPDAEEQKPHKVSNRKRKKQMNRMRADSKEIFDKLGLNSLSKQRKKKAKKGQDL